MYIDVHKAIRRLTPAPKARPLRKEIDEATSIPAGNGKLIDVDDFEEDEEPQPRNKRVNSVGAQDASVMSTSPGKTATFLMRRSSAGPDGRMTATTVPIKANLEEFKRQLKHLGPSNRNTNPRDTRSTTVKIKSVLGHQQQHIPLMASPSGLRPASIAAEPIENLDAALEDDDVEDGHDDDENTPLVRPMPMVSGKGGVQAVRKSYGGAGKSEAQTRLAGPHGSPLLNGSDVILEAHSGPQLQMPTIGDDEARNSESNNSSPTSGQRGTIVIDPGRSSSHGSVISVVDEGSSTPRRRQIVRSGSISENVVETSSGVRKIIIQAASSESDNESKESSTSATIRGYPTPTLSDQATPTVVTEEEGEEEEPTAGASASASAGKKKNKKKKKKGKA